MTENQVYKVCQSCAMPIKKDENKGTEVDKTLSIKFCQFCYKNGEFTEPSISLVEMQEKCAELFRIEHPVMSTLFGKKYVNSIAELERWSEKK